VGELKKHDKIFKFYEDLQQRKLKRKDWGEPYTRGEERNSLRREAHSMENLHKNIETQYFTSPSQVVSKKEAKDLILPKINETNRMNLPHRPRYLPTSPKLR